MGMAASQARFLSLTARKSNTEYQGQQINQQRTALGNESANLFQQITDLEVPTPPSVKDYMKLEYSFVTSALDENGNKTEYKFEELNGTPSGDEVSLSYSQTFYAPTNDISASYTATINQTGLKYNSEKIDATERARYSSYIDKTASGKTKYGIDATWTGLEINYANNKSSYILMAKATDSNIKGDLLNICSGDQGNAEFASHYLDTTGDEATIKDDTYAYFYLNENNERCYLAPSEVEKLQGIDGETGKVTPSIVDSDPDGLNFTINGQLYTAPSKAVKDKIFNKDEEADKIAATIQYLLAQFDFGVSEDKAMELDIDNDGNVTIMDATHAQRRAANVENSPIRTCGTQTSEDTGTAQKVYSYNSTVTDTYKVLRSENNDVGRLTSITIEINTADGKKEQTFELECKQVQDEAAYDQAMLDYEFKKDVYSKKMEDLNSKTKIIQNQDKQLETRLKQLDTEQSALKTEMDAVKKVADENVESTFKTFG